MTNGLVVVLGRTGKNFAAGMSGGIAFVLDDTGEFRATRCNRGGVDLDPVVEQTDIQARHTLMSRHVEATASPRGKWILDNWAEMLPKFIKVFPHEFKRVLGVKREAAAALTHEAVKVPAKQMQVTHG